MIRVHVRNQNGVDRGQSTGVEPDRLDPPLDLAHRVDEKRIGQDPLVVHLDDIVA